MIAYRIHLFSFYFHLDTFPNRSKLRAGVYFVNSLPKTTSGKPMHSKIVEITAELFNVAKYNDPIVKSFLMDIPTEFKHLI